MEAGGALELLEKPLNVVSRLFAARQPGDEGSESVDAALVQLMEGLNIGDTVQVCIFRIFLLI